MTKREPDAGGGDRPAFDDCVDDSPFSCDFERFREGCVSGDIDLYVCFSRAVGHHVDFIEDIPDQVAWDGCWSRACFRHLSLSVGVSPCLRFVGFYVLCVGGCRIAVLSWWLLVVQCSDDRDGDSLEDSVDVDDCLVFQGSLEFSLDFLERDFDRAFLVILGRDIEACLSPCDPEFPHDELSPEEACGSEVEFCAGGVEADGSEVGVDFDLDLRQFKTCEYVSPDGRDGAGAVLLDESVCDCLPEPARVSEGRGEKDNRHYDNCGQ